MLGPVTCVHVPATPAALQATPAWFWHSGALPPGTGHVGGPSMGGGASMAGGRGSGITGTPSAWRTSATNTSTGRASIGGGGMSIIGLASIVGGASTLVVTLSPHAASAAVDTTSTKSL